MRTVPGLYAERGDPHAGMDEHVGGLETVLEWYAAAARPRRRHALPAGVPEDARRADAGAALPGPQPRAVVIAAAGT